MKSNRYKGFTLIELMITVVIIAVLVAIAYPSYRNYVTQTRRSDAHIGLTQTAALLEKYFTECNTYTLEPKNNPALTPPARRCPAAGNEGLGLPNDLSPERHYQLSIAAGTIAGAGGAGCTLISCGFTITANPNGAGVTGRQKTDGRFQLDSTGVRRWDRNNDNDYNDPNETSWKK